MKFGSYLLAASALVALATSPAVARHRGHIVHSHTSHQHSDSAPRDTDKTEVIVRHDKTDTTTEQSTKPSNEGTGDHGRLGERKPGKTSVSAQDRRAPGKDEVGPPEIDTRITVHQGHETIKTIRKHHFNDAASKVTVGVDAKHVTHDHRDRHREVTNRPTDKERRNAVGAKVDNDKPLAEHRNAAGLVVNPSPSLAPDPKRNSTPTQVVVTTHDPTTTHGPDKGQLNQAKGAPLSVIPPNGSSIAGTDLIRPTVRTGAISGTPKVAGVVSGNTIHLKHP